MDKLIALVDCDSFFVSCEQAVKPDLAEKPVCVLSNRDGCIVARSKEAKKLGIKMGMPYFMAKQEFPEAIYLSGNHELYLDISNKVIAILKDFSPVVDVYSIDEAFVDFTGLERLYKRNSFEIAKLLRYEIKTKLKMPVSIGLSSTKTLAKLASDKAKNVDEGVYFIGKGNLENELINTPIEDIWGIGKRLTLKMRQNGILTASELVKKSDSFLNNLVGINGIHLKHELLGEIVSPLTNDAELPKSIQRTSALETFSKDKNYLKNTINYHIHRACVKLRAINAKTREIGIILKTKDYNIYVEKEILNKPLDFEFEISSVIFRLFEKIYSPDVIYRSTGIFFDKLVYENVGQGFLFSDVEAEEKKAKLAKCFDRLEEKFGKNIIQTGFMKKGI